MLKGREEAERAKNMYRVRERAPRADGLAGHQKPRGTGGLHKAGGISKKGYDPEDDL